MGTSWDNANTTYIPLHIIPHHLPLGKRAKGSMMYTLKGMQYGFRYLCSLHVGTFFMLCDRHLAPLIVCVCVWYRKHATRGVQSTCRYMYMKNWTSVARFAVPLPLPLPIKELRTISSIEYEIMAHNSIHGYWDMMCSFKNFLSLIQDPLTQSCSAVVLLARTALHVWPHPPYYCVGSG